MKVLFSICLGATSLAFLGFASAAGGVSAGYANLKEQSTLTNDQKELLRKFETSGKDNHPAGKDFISIVRKFWETAKR